MSTAVGEVEEVGKSFFAREPVLLLHATTSVVVYTATSVGLDKARADKLVNLLVPPAVVLLLMIQGFLIRRFVTPAWKRLQASAAKDGIDVPDLPAPPDLTDTEVAELAAMWNVGDSVKAPPPLTPGTTTTTPAETSAVTYGPSA